jgi:hypothetical protein
MGSISSEHDFIVVGGRVHAPRNPDRHLIAHCRPGGPSGATVAWRLAHSKKRPSVLLVEAGGKNDLKALRTDGDRYAELTFSMEKHRTYPLTP